MGKVLPDPGGRIKGKIGDTVYYLLGRNNIGRKMPLSHKVSTSDEATRVKNIFKERTTWASATLEASKLGFPQATVNMSAGNLFMAENKDRFTQEDLSMPVAVDFEKMQFSKGRLEEPEVNYSYEEAGNSLTFTITDNSGDPGANPDDQICVVVLETERKRAKVSVLASREESGIKTVTIPSRWNKDNLQVYTFATNKRLKIASPTVYLGTSSPV